MSNFNNGAWVSRVYGDTIEGEVVAEFQYTQMARSFARDYMASCDADAPFYMVVTDSNNGRVEIFRQPKHGST